MIPQLDKRAIDLGRDRARMKDGDARRQHATVARILEAFYGSQDQQAEVQLLADEVGLGKTFVALGTAYAVLDSLRNGDEDDLHPDLNGCYRVALVLTPASNHALSDKWNTEAEAILTRCSPDPSRVGWFKAKRCEHLDELLEGILRGHDRRRKAPCVLIAEASIFSKRLADPGVRFLLASLFRWWGKAVPMVDRYHLVRGLSSTAGSGEWNEDARWVGEGEYEIELWNWDRHERFLAASDAEREEWKDRTEARLFSNVSVPFHRMAEALEKFSRDEDGIRRLEDLRDLFKAVPLRRPGDQRTGLYREWRESFYRIKDQLRDLYKSLWRYLLEKRLPLVIADEAHHWRNSGRVDCRNIRELVAPLSRRLLLLTATPFQLQRSELGVVLSMSDAMEPAIGATRCAALKGLRERLEKAMESSEKAGRTFSKEWGELGDQLGRWKEEYRRLAMTGRSGDPRTNELGVLWDRHRESLDAFPAPLRPFFARARDLHDANRRLQGVMRRLIIRHRRPTQHREYLIGREYPPGAFGKERPDRNQLHLAPGAPMPPDAELVQYLLMSVVADLSRGRRRTALGTALTGCYTTLWDSEEGRKALEAAGLGRDPRFRLLKELTGHGLRENPKDATHPKVERVVKEVLERWDKGQKSLVFCFRVRTAEVLHRLIEQGIEDRRRTAIRRLLKTRGTEDAEDSDRRDKAMQQFRQGLTARTGSGVALFLDRVLLGWMRYRGLTAPVVTDTDIETVATLSSRAVFRERRLFEEVDRPDRVFLHRALEHVVARRLVTEGFLDNLKAELKQEGVRILGALVEEKWIERRYGVSGSVAEGEKFEADHAARVSLAAIFRLSDQPDSRIAAGLLARWRTRRQGVIATLFEGANLWLPSGEARERLSDDQRQRSHAMLESLWKVTLGPTGNDPAWEERAKVSDALMRAFLRDDILLRLSPATFEGDQETWASSLLRGFHESSDGVSESVATRVAEFLGELTDMGPDERRQHLEYAARVQASAVELVKGGSRREGVFTGFNTPLLPDILVCTQVGQEGIDLHRQCRHIVHFDLGWNPATVEQRTGRVDRLGSKALREREAAHRASLDRLPGLDIGMPFLAGTYDDRMFEVLRARAQAFDILTGGDPTADREEGVFWLDPDDEGEEDGAAFVPLPRKLLDDLRVDLQVTPFPS